MRLSSCVHFVVLLCVGACVFSVANKYDRLQKTVNKMNAGIEQEHENIRVLQAEWAFLTNPVRLEKIAAANFQLAPMDGRQLVALNIVPMTDSFDEAGQVSAENMVAQNNAGQELVQRYATTAQNLPAPKPLALPVLTATPVSDVRDGQ